MTEKPKRERIWYWDILRIAAVVCLVIRHISTACFDFVEPLGFRWWVFNAYGSLVAWMVPVYLMLSGAWFLDPEVRIDTRTLWRKNILRMLIAFAVWSVLYTAYNLLSGQDRVTPVPQMLLQGHFHLWFLPMIAGVYMLVPALRPACRDLKHTACLFFTALTVSVAIPMLQDLGWLPGEETLPALTFTGFLSAHICFFTAGHLFHRAELSRGQRRILYGLAAAATVCMFAGTWLLTRRDGVNNEDLQSDANLLSGIQGIALFVFVKQRCKNAVFQPQVKEALKTYSALTFGVYLVHVMPIAYMDKLGFSGMSHNPLWMIPLMICLVVPLSFLLTWLIRKIPFAGRWIT